MTIVPRKREAAMSGVEIARRGGRAADPKLARREALEAVRLRALADVLGSADETARLLELAAANPAMRAGPLLEAYGQGGVGPLRTLAFWRRNGCRVVKGERAVLLSMFGNAFYGRKQVAGPDPGGIGTRERPPNALPDVGEGYGMAILAARAGLRLRAEWSQPDPFTDETPVMLRPAVIGALPSLAVLESALAAVAEYDDSAEECLSCAGTGCVLCACQDDRPSRRVSVKPSGTLPRVEKQPRKQPRPAKTARPIGRPRKVRPDVAAVRVAADDAARLRAEADRLNAQATAGVQAAIAAALAEGFSYRDIAAAAGVSVARIAQLAPR